MWHVPAAGRLKNDRTADHRCRTPFEAARVRMIALLISLLLVITHLIARTGSVCDLSCRHSGITVDYRFRTDAGRVTDHPAKRGGK